ncbi:DMT family transporter [Fusobacterium sp. MFO224]|uniref:DMT family transporter n=1 Tax=Fusobacterium sp. MFO224 TaxID=3378070 RepID=UPI003854D895
MLKQSTHKIILFLVAFCWGCGFPLSKIVLNSGIEPFALSAIRLFGASFLTFLIIHLYKIEVKKNEIKLGLLSGSFMGLAFAFQTAALLFTTPSNNAFLTGAYVIGTPLITWLFTKRRPKIYTYLSASLCFVGIGFLSLNGKFQMNMGDILTLICAIFFSLQMVILGIHMPGKNAFSVNAFQLFSGGLLTLILNIFFENFSLTNINFDFQQILAVLFLTVFNIFLGFLAQTQAQKYVEPSILSLILSTEILFGVALSIIFYHDPMTPKILIGGFLIVLSIIVSETKLKFKREEF